MARTCLAGFVLVFGAAVEAGPVIHVDDDAPPGGDGRSWDTAYRFLQDALAGAVPPAEVHVAQGLYAPDRDERHEKGTGDRDATFRLDDGIAIKGGYAGIVAPDPDARDVAVYETVLSGDLLGNDTSYPSSSYSENSRHVVTADATGATAILDGLTIAHGMADGPALDGAGLLAGDGSPTVVVCRFDANYATYRGGAIAICGGSPTISSCAFEGNEAFDDGGAIFNDGGSPLIAGCVFTDQVTATDGAAIANWNGGAGTITGCTFTSNDAGLCVFECWGYGGGIYNEESDPTIRECLFIDNTATLGGTAIANSAADPTVRDCQLLAGTTPGTVMVNGDSSPFVTGCSLIGGIYNSPGVLNYGGSPVFVNCVIADHLNDGMFNDSGSTPHIINCTFWYNVGAGIYNSNGSAPLVDNSIFWDTGPYQIFDAGSSATTVRYSNVEEGFPGAGNIDVDPQFVDEGAGDLRLQATSPCIDAAHVWALAPDTADLDADGDTRELTPLDLDGNPRLADATATDDTGCGAWASGVPDMGAYEFQDVPVGNAVYLGDLDADRSVGVLDFLALLAAWGRAAACAPADLDLDGEIGIADLLLLLAQWG